MWLGIIGAIKGGAAVVSAMPAIIKAIRDVIGWLQNEFGPDWPARLADLKAASTQWSAAQTTQERADAASAMAKAFNSSK